METYNAAYFLKALLQLGVLWFSLSLHEFGHAYAADRLGDPTPRMLGRLTISPFAHLDPIGTVLIPLVGVLMPVARPFLIGWAKPVPISPVNFRRPGRDEMIVSFAGPGMNFLLVIVFLLTLFVGERMGWLASSEGLMPQFVHLCWTFILLNLVLGVFNLLPIPPLDGHWILKAVLPARWGDVFARVTPYGFVILLALLFTGLLDRILTPFLYLLLGVMELLGLGGLLNRMVS
jgi:Zn-dependent protease